MSEQRQEAARSLGLRKSDSQAYYERGLTLFARGNYEEAVVDISEAIYYDQGRAELYAARGFIFQQWAHEKKLPDKLENAMTDLTYAIKLNRRQWFAHLALGIIDFENGQWSDAFKHFTDAKEASPGRPEPWFYRALCQYKLEKYGPAEEDMNIALRWMDENDKRRKEAERWLKEFAGQR
jgi:tetratricopeptide (TPR) repeat protein